MDTVTLYVRNPYARIPPSLVRSICRACGIDLSYGAQELWNLDRVCQDPWFEPVREAKPRLHRLSLEALVCYAARLGAPLSGLPPSLHTREVMLLLISRMKGRVRIKLLKSLSDEDLLELLIQIGYYPDRTYLNILTRAEKEERFRLIRPLPYTERHRILATRYQEVNSHPQGPLIKRLYGEGDQYLHATPTWGEGVIRSLGVRDEELCRALQIRVPEGHTTKEWLQENILEYLPIWNRRAGEVEERRTQGLSWFALMTDEEIAQECRIYLRYSSRPQLVEILHRMHRSPTFFLPRSEWPRERALNRNFETFGLGLDIRTSEELLIGFGSCSKAYLYTVEDLLGSFFFEDDFFAFRCPHAPQREIFNERQIRDLISLLERETVPGVRELLTQISLGRQWQTTEGNKRSCITRTFKKMVSEDQTLLRSLLFEIISTGFYARRWEGPGTPLPLRESDTLKDLDPDPLTKKSWASVSIDLQKAPSLLRTLMWSLRPIRYRYGVLEPQKETFKQWWKGVGRGTLCIRIASAVLIGTAHYYLDLLFSERTDFRIEELDLII